MSAKHEVFVLDGEDKPLTPTTPARGSTRAPYSRGTVFGLRKGLRIGTPNGKVGQLCGEIRGGYRYYDARGRRQSAKRVVWISTHFTMRGGSQGKCVGPRPTRCSRAA